MTMADSTVGKTYLFLFYLYAVNRYLLKMSTATKVGSQAKKSKTPKSAAVKKSYQTWTDGKPKVIQGMGRNVAYMADTLFDDDLR